MGGGDLAFMCASQFDAGLWQGSDSDNTLTVIVANVHIFTAFLIAAFVLTHLYILTIGHGFRESVRPMLTGYERLPLTKAQAQYLQENEPKRLKE